MNGQPSSSASRCPSVDLPAPRSPTSAIRRARSADRRLFRARLDQVGDRGKLGQRHAAQEIEDVGHRGGAAVAARQQFDDRNVERLGDRLEHDDGRVALAAFDLREIALGRAGALRKLPPRHAALGAAEPHQPADLGGERI